MADLHLDIPAQAAGGPGAPGGPAQWMQRARSATGLSAPPRWASEASRPPPQKIATDASTGSIPRRSGTLPLDRRGTVASMLDTPEDEWWEEPERDHCGSALVMREANPFRRVWRLVVGAMLAYTATIFIYRVCFIEFRIEDPDILSEPRPEEDLRDLWWHCEVLLNAVFAADLVLEFFFSRRDGPGHEVDSLRLIAKHYLRGTFGLNLVACLPEGLLQLVVAAVAGSGDEAGRPLHGHQALRVWRLQRASRLARVAVRLRLLAKLASSRPSGRLWRWFEGLRGVRVVSNAVGLIWVAHLLACGWYLCAALHRDPKDTWVFRRSVHGGAEEEPLLQQDPFEQWAHAFYFVLTVFTTVGFGDITAVTEGEILYVCMVMVVGTVVHSIIISEVIQIVTQVDETEAFVTKQAELIDAFAAHTELREEQRNMISDWVTWNAKSWSLHRYDREEVKQLITGKSVPRWLLGQLPSSLFGGRLARSAFLLGGVIEVPPRLPVLLALAMQKVHFGAGEIVYQMHDFPFSLFLVLDGTFANVARPTRRGGVDESCDAPPCEQAVDATAGGQGDMTATSSVAMWFAPSPRAPARGPSLEKIAPMSTHLYPYRLYGRDNYFGEAELIEGRPRRATVRCESDSGGSGLLLQKADFQKTCEEFPQFGTGWRLAARRREVLRRRELARLRCGMTIRHLAATRIQQWALRAMHWRRTPARRSLPPLGVGGGGSPLWRGRSAGAAAALREASEAAAGGERGPCEGCATKCQVLNLHHGMDALRSDFASLRQELRAAVNAVAGAGAKQARRQGSGSPRIQREAYRTDSSGSLVEF